MYTVFILSISHLSKYCIMLSLSRHFSIVMHNSTELFVLIKEYLNAFYNRNYNQVPLSLLRVVLIEFRWARKPRHGDGAVSDTFIINE